MCPFPIGIAAVSLTTGRILKTGDNLLTKQTDTAWSGISRPQIQQRVSLGLLKQLHVSFVTYFEHHDVMIEFLPLRDPSSFSLKQKHLLCALLRCNYFTSKLRTAVKHHQDLKESFIIYIYVSIQYTCIYVCVYTCLYKILLSF